MPKGYAHRDVAGVAVDGEDRVYLMCRGDHPVMIYDQKGKFMRSWGEGEFTYRTHGIYVAPERHALLHRRRQSHGAPVHAGGQAADDDGHLNTPSDTGYDGKDHRHHQARRGPFNRPTNIAVGPNGDIYISDGYGNARVHIFSPKGELKRSWGEPGSGPGQFHLPHGIACSADGRVWVCDRESRPHPDLQPGRRVPERVDGHPAARRTSPSTSRVAPT